MSRIVNFTEAASIGIHAVVLIARAGTNLINVNFISERTSTSKHHVAKVVQRLVKAGILDSSRGPSGGFTLKHRPENISFLEVYEAIEGKIEIADCPNKNPVCPFDKCLMGNVISNMTREFRDYLKSQLLKDYLE